MNTETISKLLQQPRKTNEQVFHEAKRALLDYLGCLKLAIHEKAVDDLVTSLELGGGTTKILGRDALTTPERAALINGFTGHYLDFDDVQPNFRGHPSVVIFSALFAISNDNDDLEDLLWAYIQGVELAGQFGKLLNPRHAVSGWHSTATIGTIAATAAIAVFRNLSEEQTTAMLSVASSQAAGMLFQAGTDNKPLHAGFAARNAVTAYQIVEAGLTTSLDPFNNQNGWLKVIGDVDIDEKVLDETWLNPAQIVAPGLWFKQHQFCSAAISGYDAATHLWSQGIRWDDCDKIVVHYPKNGDRVLNQKRPVTGQQGKFSIEYIVWQVLHTGDVDDIKFNPTPIDKQFFNDIKIFSRVNDLKPGKVTQRPAKLEVIVNGLSVFDEVDDPVGSPDNPLSEKKIANKIIRAVGSRSSDIFELLKNNHTKISELKQVI